MTKKVTSFKTSASYYYKPTPAKWRRLGDALLAVSTTITMYAVADDWSKWITIAALLLGSVGKFLSNFFTEDIVEVPEEEDAPVENP